MEEPSASAGRNAERQQNGPRAVIAADRVVRIGELRAEQDLRHVMAARGELVEDLALRGEHLLFQLVQRARELDAGRRLAPVGRCGGVVAGDAGVCGHVVN